MLLVRYDGFNCDTRVCFYPFKFQILRFDYNPITMQVKVSGLKIIFYEIWSHGYFYLTSF